MTVQIQSDYTTANGFRPLNYARILHAGNWVASDDITVSGDGTNLDSLKNSLTYEKWTAPVTLPASVRYTFNEPKAINCICIAAHNMSGAEVAITYFDTATMSSAFMTNIYPTDNSPIMLLFNTITTPWVEVRFDTALALSLDFVSETYSIYNGATQAQAGVVKMGQALEMYRPFYGGFSPTPMQRASRVVGNVSEGGEWLGRTRVRSAFRAQYQWANLPYDWVRANLDGASGLIRNLETEPFFIAWRPNDAEADVVDCDFAWTTGPVAAPNLNGTRNLMSFEIAAEGYGYG